MIFPLLAESLITPDIPLGSLIVTGILIPLAVWLFKSLPGVMKNNTILHKRVDDVCGEVTVMRKELDHVRHSDGEHEKRLARVEDAITAIRDSAQRRDEQFAQLNSKLDQIPQITAMMQALNTSAQAIVPRSEVEGRLAGAEHRLALLEQDIRKAQSR